MDKTGIDDIKNLSSEEFKKKILEWIEEQGINDKLQSRLRCGLIENFNKTVFGQGIQSRFQSEFRMMLSPLILALNTLVSEFLYAQNCHYSLSVFATEVPYKNTLPEFEKREHFRFNRTELNEIFLALGLKCKSLEATKLSELYFKNGNKTNNSLLFFIFQSFIEQITQISLTSKDTPKIQTPSKLKSHTKCPNCAVKFEEPPHPSPSLDPKNAKYLARYLHSMTKKIKVVSKRMEQLKTEQQLSSDILTKTKSIENLELLNASLEKLTSEFKLLDYKGATAVANGGQLDGVVLSINKLSDKFEACTKNFENLLKTVSEQNSSSRKESAKSANKSEAYGDWIAGIKESRHGQKFLKKLESSLVKTLEKEKQLHAERMEKEKMALKVYYRQKLAEHISTYREDAAKSAEVQKDAAIKELLSQQLKLQETFEKTQKSSNLEKEEAAKKTALKKSQKVKLSRHTVVEINIEPKPEILSTIIENMPLASAPDDIRNNQIETLVRDAKQRLQNLETESEKLDDVFQSYLQKQISEKSKHKMDVAFILDDLNFSRNALQRKFWHEKRNNAALTATKIKKPEIKVDAVVIETEQDEFVEPKFENPFRNFDAQAMFQKVQVNEDSDEVETRHKIAAMKESLMVETQMLADFSSGLASKQAFDQRKYIKRPQVETRNDEQLTVPAIVVSNTITAKPVEESLKSADPVKDLPKFTPAPEQNLAALIDLQFTDALRDNLRISDNSKLPLTNLINDTFSVTTPKTADEMPFNMENIDSLDTSSSNEKFVLSTGNKSDKSNDDFWGNI